MVSLDIKGGECLHGEVLSKNSSEIAMELSLVAGSNPDFLIFKRDTGNIELINRRYIFRIMQDK